MYPRKFDYIRPKDLEETVKLLGEADDAKLLAGGQSLIPLLKLRLVAPAVLLDIGRLPLDYITETGDGVRVGALTRHVQMEDSRVLHERYPLVADAVGHIADPQVRNMGTVGGSLAEADPAGDWLPVLMALGATARCVSPRGERALDVRELATGPYETTLAADEVLTEVEIPDPPPNGGSCFLKVERRAGGFALANTAVQLAMDGDICREAAIVLGAVGLTPLVAADAAELLQGERPAEALLDRVAATAAAAADPFTDVRASAEYRRVLARALVRRSLEIALRRCRGEVVQAHVLAD